jgi:hypothetical protein
MPPEPSSSEISAPAIIDVESSGLGPDSYPIEVGVSLPSGDRYCNLIHPAPSWTAWDRTAQEIHGISRETILSEGIPIGDVTRELNQLLRNRTVYTDGWVVDHHWIAQLYYEAAIPQRFSVSSLETILSEEQMAIWHETKNRVIKELKLERHRASADARIVQETYMRTLRITG